LSDDNENFPDSGPELPEPQERPHPFTAVYPCKYGCGFQGTPQQLSAHYRREHRQDSGESLGEGGLPPTPKTGAKDPYVETLEQENARLKRELENALLQHRLSRYQPTPSPTLQGQDLVASDPLLRVKYAQLLDAIREQEEIRKQALKGDGDNSVLITLQNQLESYKEELSKYHEKIEELKETIRQKDLENLKMEIANLREQVAKRGESDFAIAVNALSERIDRLGERFETMVMASWGYQKIPIGATKNITEEAVKAEENLIQRFQERGWVTEA
jgi:hypothetical protein